MLLAQLPRGTILIVQLLSLVRPVPPDIINEESSADLAVQEGEDATLTCRATGNPQPRVIWRREDGEMILIRKPGSRELIKGATDSKGNEGVS